MPWQDLIFAVGSAIFSIALIPTVLGASKPALSTSLMTGGILAVFVPTYFSLELYYSMITGATTAGLWFVLAWQEWRNRREGALIITSYE